MSDNEAIHYMNQAPPPSLDISTDDIAEVEIGSGEKKKGFIVPSYILDEPPPLEEVRIKKSSRISPCICNLCNSFIITSAILMASFIVVAGMFGTAYYLKRMNIRISHG